MKRLRLNTWCFLCFVMNKIWVYVIWQSQFLFIFSTTSQLFWNQSTNHGSYATSLFVVIFTNKTFSSLTLVFSFSLTHREESWNISVFLKQGEAQIFTYSLNIRTKTVNIWPQSEFPVTHGLLHICFSRNTENANINTLTLD